MPGRIESPQLPLPTDSCQRHLLRAVANPSTIAQPEANQQRQEQGLRRAILCTACKTPVTSEDQAIAINNGHRHTFPNPLGLVFTIRCFATAPGCIPQGEATPEYSWFNGYRWRIALCRECLTHLGWQYLGDNDLFFGLIAAKLCNGTEST